MVLTKEFEKGIDRLLDRAQYTRTKASQIGRILCDMTDINYLDPNSFLIGETKTRERTIEKALNDYNGDISKINDPTRFMGLFDCAGKQIPKIQKLILPNNKGMSAFEKALEETKFRLIEAKDHIQNPKKWGYMCYLLKFEPRSEADQQKYSRFEIQITSKPMQHYVYPLTHDMYEPIRKQIENYMANQTPLYEWNEHTLKTVLQMREMHIRSAYEYDMKSFIGDLPKLEGCDIFLPEDDVPQITYAPNVLDNNNILSPHLD